MRRFFPALVVCLLFSLSALCESRALLVACSRFTSQPDLGKAGSGNLQLLSSALMNAGFSSGTLYVEDGTVGTVEALEECLLRAFGDAEDSDLSILYLCTHGFAPADGEATLLLSDGSTETPLSGRTLRELLARLPGERLLIVDACTSGALIGHGSLHKNCFEGSGIHVLTSAQGWESAWYYDSEHMESVSYFCCALSQALGLYGYTDADIDGDGLLTLMELHQWLLTNLASSTAQLYSPSAGEVVVPSAAAALVPQPLTGFTFSDCQLTPEQPALPFSYTVQTPCPILYRIVRKKSGTWMWESAVTLTEKEGESVDRGRLSRTLKLKLSDDSAAMVQVFALEDAVPFLCAERLLSASSGDFSWDPDPRILQEGDILCTLKSPVPLQIHATLISSDGHPMQRLLSGQMLCPDAGGEIQIPLSGADPGDRSKTRLLLRLSCGGQYRVLTLPLAP